MMNKRKRIYTVIGTLCLFLVVLLCVFFGCSRKKEIISYEAGKTKGFIEVTYPPFEKVALTDEQVRLAIQLINSISFTNSIADNSIPDGDSPVLHIQSNEEEYCFTVFSNTLLAFNGLVYDVSASSETVSELNKLIGELDNN